MSHFANLTGRFRAVPKENSQDSTGGKITKRPRDSHVCTQCKKAKLKCDRSLPCGSCMKRGDAAICNYLRLTSSTAHDGSSHSSRQSVAEDRLLHLESLVRQLMENQASAQAGRDAALGKPVTPPVARSDAAPDAHHEEANPTRYVGSTHWSAILDDIHELKAALGGTTHGQERDDGSTASEPFATPSSRHELIFGFSGNYSLAQILSQYLPQREEVDRLLAIYFQGETFIVPFIHTYQFQRQYREFWTGMTSVNPLWLSILFSICCIATSIRAAHGGFVPDTPMAPASSNFHAAAGQCLVLGEYYRPQPLTVEALGLYAQYKNLKSLDPSREAQLFLEWLCVWPMRWDITGILTHLAPSQCLKMDLMISFQLGLPSTICLENCDTRSPRNLMDSDFDEDTSVLPPARPESEATKLLWFIVKDRQMPGFGKVYQDALSFREKTETEVLHLDHEIQQMYETIPEILRARPLSESITDSPFVIMTRLYIDFIYLKSLLVLHRRYMARGNLSSTRSCVSAGTRLVSQFIAMYKEMAPGGLLHTERWMLTNFTMNDFLLGVMVLCLIVHIRRQNISRSIPSFIDAASEAEVVALLEQAVAICTEKSSLSKDARRVSVAIRLVLESTKSSSMLDTAETFSPNIRQSNNASSPQDVDLAPLLLQPQDDQHYPSGNQELSFGVLDPFNFMGNDFERMDWMIFDPQMMGQDSLSTHLDEPEAE